MLGFVDGLHPISFSISSSWECWKIRNDIAQALLHIEISIKHLMYFFETWKRKLVTGHFTCSTWLMLIADKDIKIWATPRSFLYPLGLSPECESQAAAMIFHSCFSPAVNWDVVWIIHFCNVLAFSLGSSE